METVILILNALIILGLFFFAKYYLPSYFKKKGENLAKIEDLNKIDLKLEKVKTDNSIKIEEYKTDINQKANIEIELLKTKLLTEYEVAKTYLVKYSQEQFNIYNDLWTNLCELEISVDKLWEDASINNLKKFATQIKVTRDSLKKGALLVEDAHYKELNFILDRFEEFQFGKKNLIDFRKKPESFTDFEEVHIHRIINSNMTIRNELKNYLSQMMNCLKNQIAYKNQRNSNA